MMTRTSFFAEFWPRKTVPVRVKATVPLLTRFSWLKVRTVSRFSVTVPRSSA